MWTSNTKYHTDAKWKENHIFFIFMIYNINHCIKCFVERSIAELGFKTIFQALNILLGMIKIKRQNCKSDKAYLSN